MIDEQVGEQVPGGAGRPNRTTWPAIVLCLLVTAALELVLAWTLPSAGASVGGPALAVAAVGLLPVVLTTLFDLWRRRTGPPSRTAWALWAGAAFLAVGGGIWVASGGSVALRFRLTDQSRMAQLVALANHESAHWNDGCASGQDFPQVPGLGTLDEVCAWGGTDPQVEFDGPGYGDASGTGVAYVWSPRTNQVGIDECVSHLEGPWWELTSGLDGTACPAPFNGVGGP